jgi:hypothetical protein
MYFVYIHKEVFRCCLNKLCGRCPRMVSKAARYGLCARKEGQASSPPPYIILGQYTFQLVGEPLDVNDRPFL